MPLKNLEEHNTERERLYRFTYEYPQPNGIACPECREELMDSDALSLTSMPPKRNIHCPGRNCVFMGYRVD